MKKVPVEEAIGLPLFHDMTMVKDGVKSVRFKRGHIVAQEDLPALLDMGKRHVFTGIAPKGLMHEEDAGRAMAEALCGEGVSFAGPSEGKLMAVADIDGLFVLNSEALYQINSSGDYTIACIKGFSKAKAGMPLAGVRIKPLLTEAAYVESACAIAKKAYPVLSVKPYKPLATGIILTGSEILSGRVKDRFEPILRDKVKEYGSRVLGVKMRGDSKDAIADAIHELICEGAALVLLAGGMSVDPDDATEAAMKAACGNLVFSGVPMQPGNMLALGCIGSAAVVGVPGASLVHAKTSLDVFLPRIFAGAEITKDDAARLGEGGLL